MQELQLNYETEEPTVSARDLHEGLGINTPFRKWFPRMCEYGFVEGQDYTPDIFVHPHNKQETMDYQITLDMAKQICMLQRNEKGREYRIRLIHLEKAWNTPEQVMARALKIAGQTIDTLKNQNTVLIEDVERMKPKEVFADSVANSVNLILLRDLAKLLKQNGYDTGERRFIQWMKDNGYIIRKSSPPMPTQRAMELKLFRIIERTINDGRGNTIIKCTTKVTGKGQQYFMNKFICGGMQDGTTEVEI